MTRRAPYYQYLSCAKEYWEVSVFPDGELASLIEYVALYLQ
jgi:hypothetical protein